MALPDFVVAGVARAGTTTLYNLLKKHNQIYLPNVKETNYFSNATSKNIEDYSLPEKNKEYHTKIINEWSVYEELFSIGIYHNKLKGDISPSYMWDKNSAKRIKDKNKNAKIIISLRSPVERAISHYKMNYITGFEKEKVFSKAVYKKYDGYWGGGNCYLMCSLYFDAIKSFYDNFGRNNVLVIIYEDWINNQKQTVNKITDFLKINNLTEKDYIYTHENKINSVKNIKILNFFRNKNIKSWLKKILSEGQIKKIKKNIFEGGEMEILVTKEEKKELQKLFYDDVKKTSKLIEEDLLSKWKFNQEIHN